MIDEKKKQAIELLVENSKAKYQIAEEVGVTRQALWKWMRNEEFKAELTRSLRTLQEMADSNLKFALQNNLNTIQELANSGTSEKMRFEASKYLVDRVLGNTTSKIDITADVKNDNIDSEVIEAEFSKWDEENKEE